MIVYPRTLLDLPIIDGKVYAKYMIPMNSNSDSSLIIGPIVYTTSRFFMHVIVNRTDIEKDCDLQNSNVLDMYRFTYTLSVADATRAKANRLLMHVTMNDTLRDRVTLKRIDPSGNMTRLCKSLKDELLRFIDAVECILDDHNIPSSDIAYIRVFMMQLTPDASMQYVIDKILPLEDKIKSKNESFFYDNDEIFGKLPKSKVNYFSDLVKSGTLTKDDKAEIWEFFATFIAYAKQYKKRL